MTLALAGECPALHMEYLKKNATVSLNYRYFMLYYLDINFTNA